MDTQGSVNIGDQAYCSTHLINQEGILNESETGLQSFTGKVKLAECGISYVVVSVLGPQSSGLKPQKVFGWQTVLALNLALLSWILRGPMEVNEARILCLKDSALFALAVSDIVLINIWWHDVNREHAANKPLLKTVFQVMLQLFPPRKTTLLFVIRDTSIKTPLDKIEFQLKDSIQKIWDSVPKPEARKQTSLSEVFRVEVVALSNFETEVEIFTEQVANLRKRFFHSIAPGGLAGDRRGVVPASDFSLSAKKIWTDIKANKDLDLPTHKVMLATVRCEEIAKQKLSSFEANMEWCKLKAEVQSHPVTDFGMKLGSILDICLSEYDTDTTYYEDSVRSAKQKELEEKLLKLVQPAYSSMLEHIRSETLDEFKCALKCALHEKKELAEGIIHDYTSTCMHCTTTCMEHFDKRCADLKFKQSNWDNGSVRLGLGRDIELAALELVQPVYHSMLEHIRSETLDEFDNALKCALKQRQELPREAVGDYTTTCMDCSATSMKRFDKRCADVKFKQESWDSGSVRIQLDRDIELAALKLVQPFYHSMLELIRSETLDEFKYALKSALKERDELAEESVSNCTKTYMERFNKRCADVKFKQENWDSDGVRIQLGREIEVAAVELVLQAYHLMLESIRSKTLDEFKDDLQSALNEGKKAEAAVRECTATCMEHFDKSCADLKFKQSNCDNGSVRTGLSRDIELAALELVKTHGKEKEKAKGLFGLAADVVIAPVKAAGKLGDHIVNELTGESSIAGTWQREVLGILRSFKK